MNIKILSKIVLITIIISLIIMTRCNSQSIDEKQKKNIIINKSNQSIQDENSFINTKSHTCPYGIKHERYPRCGLYEDKNNNEYCDLSE